ncbi:heterokaryon incompatibility protein-domain-containing protein [Clohesyomyces aquaticus]|uniref:Heterokaryon incompatibility protein-domain-containing protein n=1 Tax=Clohesyomyces aquaticus TaxID=1231657 RepID=A0A1Y1YUX3_9PLEO|nr:heterokaryon incompatibility protein-domain-containing protein [Clohesyomyces aquaticus]
MHYPYKSIDPDVETRVLTFLPSNGRNDAPIVCSLIHTALDSPVLYEALSYVWGNSVIGALNNADPEKEVFGWNMASTGISKTFTKAKMNDLVDHTSLQYPLFGQGFPRPEGMISIDGTEVVVGGELYSALKRLRSLWETSETSGSQGMAVWIDALCINQQDIQERNNHVTKMNIIYRNAKAVRIWLGDVVSDSDNGAFEALFRISGFLDQRFAAGDFKNYRTLQRSFAANEEMQSIQWNCLSSMLNRAWFRRTWVIQEVGVANKATIHLGPLSTSWEMLSGVILILRNYDIDVLLWAYTELTADITIALMDKLQKRQREQKHDQIDPPETPITLLEILHESRDFKCTVQSDKVYGVLGLADDRDDYPAPDYALPVADVFKGIARSHIAKTNGLTILYHCSESGEGLDQKIPSWTPDWTRKCHHTPFYLTSLKCHASGSSLPSFTFAGDALMVQGCIVDHVQTVENVRNIPRNTLQAPEHVAMVPDIEAGEVPMWASPDIHPKTAKDWLKEHMRNQRDYMNNIMDIAFPDQVVTGPKFDALWRSFVCNQIADETAPSAEWGAQFSKFVARLRNADRSEGSGLKDILNVGNGSRKGGCAGGGAKWDLTERFETYAQPEMDRYHEFVKANGMWCYNRRFFKTQSDRFGWGPDGMKDGDVVAILGGLDVPLVLRPGEDGYEVVGDCFLHGIMMGEALEDSPGSSEVRLV